MAGSNTIKAGGAYVELSANSAALERGLRMAQNKLNAFGDSVQQMGRQMAMAGAAIAAPFVLATQKGVGFTDTMAIVGAVTQATARDFESLNQKAKELGATTSFTAQQVADGMVSLGRAGYETDQILAAIPDVLNLSRATATELGEAAEIAAAAMRGFGLEASDTARISDVLTTAANGSAQTLVDLGEAMKMVAPQASEAGETIENTAAALGVLANNGIKGTMAGNALARAFKNLSASDAQNMLRDLNVQAVDARGNIRPLNQILTELGQATAKMGTAQRLNIFEQLFGRGQAAALKLAAPGAVFEDMAKKMNEANGSASRLAKAMDDNLGGSFRILMSAVEGLHLDIFDAIQGSVRGFADGLTKAAGSMAAFVRENAESILITAKLTAATIGLSAALYGVGTAAKVAAFGVGVASKAYAVAAITVKVLAGAVNLAAAAFAALNSGITLAAVATSARMIPALLKFRILETLTSSTYAMASAMGALQLSVTGVTLAVLKFVALPIAVALAGYQVGKYIADWTGLSAAIEKAYFWLFNIKELNDKETKSALIDQWNKQLKDGLITAEEYERRLKAIENIAASGTRGGDDGPEAPAGDPAGDPEPAQASGEESSLAAQRLYLQLMYEGYELRRAQLDLEEDAAIKAAENNKARIAQIKDEYALRRLLLDEEQMDKKDQEAARKAEETAKKIAAEKEERARREQDIKQRIADLELRTAFSGIKLERERLKLAEKRAMENVKGDASAQALLRKEFELEQKLLDQQEEEMKKMSQSIATPREVFGSFSAREVSGRAADQSVKELNKANAHLSSIEKSSKALADQGLGLA